MVVTDWPRPIDRPTDQPNDYQAIISTLEAMINFCLDRYKLGIDPKSDHLEVMVRLMNPQVTASRAAALLLVGDEKTRLIFVHKLRHQELIDDDAVIEVPV